MPDCLAFSDCPSLTLPGFPRAAVPTSPSSSSAGCSPNFCGWPCSYWPPRSDRRAGCTALYFFGRKGGELALRRFDGEYRERVKDQIGRNGFGAIFIAAMGPPPFPTKLFVISAGVFGMPLMTLVSSMMIGRALRYSIAAYLGVMLGEQAIVFLHDHAAHALVAVLLLAALFGLVQLIRRR